MPISEYQVLGAKFLANNKYALLADEMGLGKTVQALSAFILVNVETINPGLVICPASLTHQWVGEIDKWTGLNSVVITSANINDLFGDYDIFVMSYNALNNKAIRDSSLSTISGSS